MTKAQQQKETQEPSYTKEQFLGSRRFTGAQKDVLDALLDDGKSYTDTEVVDLINDFLERTVQ